MSLVNGAANHNVSVIAGSANGNFAYADGNSTALTIGTVGALKGITSVTGSASASANNGTLTVGEAVNAPTAIALTSVKVPESKRSDSAVAAARAAIELAEQSQSVGPINELEQKVAADPKDHQARFDLALALNAKGSREAAVDHLMEIVKRDRKWNEDGARKQLVQFFEAWGPTDEATVAGRKRLSSILFA